MSDERFPPEIWARRYGNGVVGARSRESPHLSIGGGGEYRKYVLADPGSSYKGADLDKLEAQRDRLRDALRALLDCPNIADRDAPPWHEPETESAVDEARAALGDAEARSSTK